MNGKIFAATLLIMGCLGFLVARAVSQSATPTPASTSSQPVAPLPVLPSPLVPKDAGIIAPSATVGSTANFANVVPDAAQKTPATELTFERLAEELRRVRYRQKELKEQEATLLAKMAEKVEEKRRDFHKSQEELKQLEGQDRPAEELKEPRKTK